MPRPLGGRRRRLFVRLCLIALVQAAVVAGSAFLVREVFDGLVSGAGVGTGLLPLAGLVALPLLRAWLRHAERVSAEGIGQDYAHAVRLRLYDRLGSLAPRDIQAQESGAHLLRFLGDLTALRQWVSLGLARLGSAAITLCVCLVSLWVIAPRIGAAVAAIVAVGAALAWALGRALRASAREARRHRARLASDVSERVKAMPVVQAFSQVGRERRRVARRSGELRRAMLARARIVGLLRALADGTAGLSVAAILLVGAREIAAGRASLGAVVAAVSVVGVLTPALRDIGRSYEYWHGHAVARARIASFLARRPSVSERAAAPPLPDGPGAVAFEKVGVAGCLDGIEATAAAGSIVALVGPTGVGKSTLLALVARQLDPDSGCVRIDGHDLRRHNVASVRAAIGVVGPDLPLLRGTLLRNLRYRRPSASDDELRRICAQCGLEELAASLPQGYATRIAEGGVNLSPGQRQRIALARALLGRPRILLLDEADANLDPQSSRLLDEVLASFPGTVLFVSHRLERIRRADLVWHLDGGRLVEVGAPDQLLNANGPTRRLFARSLEHVA